MRALRLCIALALLATAPAAAANPAAESDGKAADSFGGSMLDDPDSWTLQVSRWSRMVITVTVTQGTWEDLALDGPGRCADVDLGAGQVLPGDGPLTFEVDCGRLPHGRYVVSLGVGFGTAGGNLRIVGARMAQ